MEKMPRCFSSIYPANFHQTGVYKFFELEIVCWCFSLSSKALYLDNLPKFFLTYVKFW